MKGDSDIKTQFYLARLVSVQKPSSVAEAYGSPVVQYIAAGRELGNVGVRSQPRDVIAAAAAMQPDGL